MSNTVSREPRRDRQFWLDHVQRWKHSRLSKAAYCEKHQLKAGSFYNWSRKMSATKTSVASNNSDQNEALPNFLPVKVSSSPSPLPSSAQFVHVERFATEVALPADMPPEQIQHWLYAIHQLHV